MPAISKTKCKAYSSFVSDFTQLYGSNYKVYGPYKREQDGRKIVIIYDGKSRITKQYAKVKLEIKLGRILKRSEEVDHIDGKLNNDKFSNLQLLSKVINAKKDAVHRKNIKVKCVWCNKKFILRVDQIKTRSKNNAGPFCSKSCTGSYSKYLQSGGIKKNRLSIKLLYQKGHK